MSSEWSAKYNEATIKPDPSIETHIEFLGEEEVANYFLTEPLRPSCTKTNKPIFSYIRAIAEVIKSSISYFYSDKIQMDPQFSEEYEVFRAFFVCEKRFAIETWIRKKGSIELITGMMSYSIFRIIKYFRRFNFKILESCIEKAKMIEGKDPELITITSLKDYSPISYEATSLLFDSMKKVLKKPIEKYRKNFKHTEEFRLTMKLYSCCSLFMDSSYDELEESLNIPIGDKTINQLIHNIDSIISTKVNTEYSESDERSFYSSSESKSDLGDEGEEDSPAQLEPFSQLVIDNILRTNNPRNNKRGAISSIVQRKKALDSKELEGEVLRYDIASRYYQFGEDESQIEQYIDYFEDKLTYNQEKDQKAKELYLKEDGFAVNDQQDNEQLITDFRSTVTDVADIIGVFKSFELNRRGSHIPDSVIYDLYYPMLTPLSLPSPPQSPRLQSSPPSVFESLLAPLESRGLEPEQSQDSLLVASPHSYNLDQDSTEVFRDRYKKFVETRKAKLEDLRRQHEEREKSRKRREEKEQEEKNKKRGGWLENRNREAKWADGEGQLPEVFKPMRFDQKTEVRVRPEKLTCFDQSKVNPNIENVEVEEKYEYCIPDEEIFIDGNVEYLEEDPLGFSGCTFFSEVSEMLNQENSEQQCHYNIEDPNFGNIPY